MLSKVAQWLCLIGLCHLTSTLPVASTGARANTSQQLLQQRGHHGQVFLDWGMCPTSASGFELISHSAMLRMEVSVLRQVVFFTSVTWQCPFEYQNATEQILLWQRMWEVKHWPRKLTYWGPMWNSMVSEATVPLSDQSYYLPKNAFGRGREGILVGGGRWKGKFQSSLKAATPRMKVSQRTASGRTASDPQ